MIADMDNIEIICVRAILPEVLAVLQVEGVLHLEEVPLAVEQTPQFLHRVHLDDATQARLEMLEQLEQMLGEMMPLMPSSPSEEAVQETVAQLSMADLPHWRKEIRRCSRDLRSIVRRKANVRDNLEVLEGYVRTLRAVEPLLGGHDAILGRTARAFVLQGSLSITLQDLADHLREKAGAACTLAHRKTGRHSAVGVILYPENYNEIIEEILHSHHIVSVDMQSHGSAGGTLHEIIERTRKDITNQKESLAACEEELQAFLAEHGALIAAASLVVADEAAQIRAVHFCAQSELMGVIHGWLPRDATQALKKQLDARFPAQVHAGRLNVVHDDRERIPILLRNHPIFKPFELLLSIFRPPAYGAFDPSVLVGVFFVLFYGFILGDAAYGLIIVGLFGLLRWRYGRWRPALRSAGMIGIYAGVSATIFGVLFGEFLGDLGHQLFGMKPLWFHRGHEPIRLLFIAVGVGGVHVVLSQLFGIRESLRHHDTLHAMEKTGLLCGLVAVGLAAGAMAGRWPFNTLPAILLAAALGVVCVFLLFKALGVMASVQMMEVVSLVTNILSYSRLMALGLASVALAEVANELGLGQDSLWVGIPVAVTIHLLNVCIGIFSPALHSLRLNYVESMTKFYTPAGIAYQPFKKEALK